MLDAIEFLACLAAFWTFVFSPDFRRKWLTEFGSAGAFGRCMMLLEGSAAAFCGLLPAAVLAHIAT